MMGHDRIDVIDIIIGLLGLLGIILWLTVWADMHYIWACFDALFFFYR